MVGCVKDVRVSYLSVLVEGTGERLGHDVYPLSKFRNSDFD